MSGQKATQRAAETQRAATSQTKPALELDDIDHLSRIELRLRYLADVLAESRPDVYTLLRPVWDDLEQFQECLVERWNESTIRKGKKNGAAMSERARAVAR